MLGDNDSKRLPWLSSLTGIRHQAVFSIAVDNGLIGSGASRSPHPPSCRTACGGGDVAGTRSRVLPRGRHAAGPLARKKGVPEDHQAARLGGAWTPRELRHSFVSILSAHDVRLEDISDLVGHSSTSVTETVYRHEIRPALSKEATAMNRILKAKVTQPA